MSFTLAQGSFQLPGGGPASGCIVQGILSSPGTLKTTGAAAPSGFGPFTLDTSGNVPPGASAVGNIEINPPGTRYHVTVKTADGLNTIYDFDTIIGPATPYVGTLYPNWTVIPPVAVGAAAIGGVAISGTPTVGQVLSATGPNTANWQNQGGGQIMIAVPSITGTYASFEVLSPFLTAIAFSLPINMVGSIAKLKTAPTFTTIFSVQKNGVQVGTITFAGGVKTSTLAMASSTSFAAGDELALVAPGAPDPAAAGLEVTFLATKA